MYDFNGQLASSRTLKNDRMHHSPRPDVPVLTSAHVHLSLHPVTERSTQMTGRIYAWSPVTSREVPEWPNHDRMHPMHLDWTLRSVWCNTLGYTASASTIRTHPPERPVTARVASSH